MITSVQEFFYDVDSFDPCAVTLDDFRSILSEVCPDWSSAFWTVTPETSSWGFYDRSGNMLVGDSVPVYSYSQFFEQNGLLDRLDNVLPPVEPQLLANASEAVDYLWVFSPLPFMERLLASNPVKLPLEVTIQRFGSFIIESGEGWSSYLVGDDQLYGNLLPWTASGSYLYS